MAKFSHNNAYAYISTPVLTTTTDADTFYRLEGTFTNELSQGFVIATDLLTYKGAKRHFEIKVFGTFMTDTVNTTITLGLYKNGNLEVNSQMTTLIGLPVDVRMLGLVDVICLDEDDTIEIRIKSNKAGAEVTAITMTTSCVEL